MHAWLGGRRRLVKEQKARKRLQSSIVVTTHKSSSGPTSQANHQHPSGKFTLLQKLASPGDTKPKTHRSAATMIQRHDKQKTSNSSLDFLAISSAPTNTTRSQGNDERPHKNTAH